MNTTRYRDLRESGYTAADIRSMQHNGELTRARRDGYIDGPLPDRPHERHRVLLDTTLPLLGGDPVLSHASAALLWGLPVPYRLLDRVHVTKDAVSGGWASANVVTHAPPLGPDDATHVDGYRLTSLPRTVIDLCGLCRRDEALGVMDAGWRALGEESALRAEVTTTRRRRGAGVVRWALANADPRSESPGESICRYWMILGKVPKPVLQFEVRDDDGKLLGRSDFGWPEYGVLGEFDGRVKYSDLVPAGSSAADVIMHEKRRENGFRMRGWWVLRWTQNDVGDGPAFARNLRNFLLSRPNARHLERT
ncbi:hypothetical protein [Brooklawnia cerclae]|uniref:Transcriptional regulator, AbiEi antitoxin, Type IV TA system n=1 Tax=Brooklawnia cerclae TaxID=349934 RepID=A0ABX0SAJ4_9ACTN|nr:hypothetical protein [Brooklawnia cerclae]NIH55428.1 hypothetical protein [Brooklawnia cerclae]